MATVAGLSSPEGTKFGSRALPQSYEKGKPYFIYEVRGPLEVQARKAAPWFKQEGMGDQYELLKSVQELLDGKILCDISCKKKCQH